jgi:hypothetical protein
MSGAAAADETYHAQPIDLASRNGGHHEQAVKALWGTENWLVGG